MSFLKLSTNRRRICSVPILQVLATNRLLVKYGDATFIGVDVRYWASWASRSCCNQQVWLSCFVFQVPTLPSQRTSAKLAAASPAKGYREIKVHHCVFSPPPTLRFVTIWLPWAWSIWNKS